MGTMTTTEIIDGYPAPPISPCSLRFPLMLLLTHIYGSSTTSHRRYHYNIAIMQSIFFNPEKPSPSLFIYLSQYLGLSAYIFSSIFALSVSLLRTAVLF